MSRQGAKGGAGAPQRSQREPTHGLEAAQGNGGCDQAADPGKRGAEGRAWRRRGGGRGREGGRRGWEIEPGRSELISGSGALGCLMWSWVLLWPGVGDWELGVVVAGDGVGCGGTRAGDMCEIDCRL